MKCYKPHVLFLVLLSLKLASTRRRKITMPTALMVCVSLSIKEMQLTVNYSPVNHAIYFSMALKQSNSPCQNVGFVLCT